MTLKKLVIEKKQKYKLNSERAKQYVAQEVILRKIQASEFADKVLLKGGVVMFNITKSVRRATKDMDFDIIRYDIQDAENLKQFICCLNKHFTEWEVNYLKSVPLNQDDYHGSKIYVEVKDNSLRISFTIDIGVHTLYEINQDSIYFDFGNEDKVKINVNPIEQMIAEKLFSLAKHGSLSGRYKDLSDIYYLIINCNPNLCVVKKCFELMLPNEYHHLTSTNDIIFRVCTTLNDKSYEYEFNKSNANWLDVDFNTIKNEIVTFIKE